MNAFSVQTNNKTVTQVADTTIRHLDKDFCESKQS